jgi:FAD/FMN-containing dehydrogenase
VKTVVDTESRNLRVRAAGSRWAFDDCARPDPVSVDLAGVPDTLHPAAGFLRSNWSSKVRHPDNSIVVALAGAPLWRINEELWRSGYSMLTLGGNQGQTLAGAFSTGTHGSDLDVGGVADAIHAIHLVGSGGQEYWIEREDGVTDPVLLAALGNYPYWDKSIIQVRDDDDVFLSALVAVGRFGIIFATLLEVAPRHLVRERQTNSDWGTFASRLRNLQTTGVLQSLVDEDRQIRDIKINLDPYAAGHGGFGSLIRRWKVSDPSEPLRRVQASSKGPDAVAREVDASKAYAIAMMAVPFGAGADIFAETARQLFKEQQRPSDDDVVDRNYRVTSGVPTSGMNYAEYFAAFERHGPFVVSMEYFFDGRTDDATAFVTAVYNEWRGYLAGYIAVRFATKTPALLGPEKFRATVIVEVTILQGYPHSEIVRNRVKSLASESGAVPHWGQEHLLTPPEVQAHYGSGASKWRRALARVTQAGNAETFSSSHSRRLGLEPTPAVMFMRGNRICAWLDRRQGLFAAGFHQVGLPAPPVGLRIRAPNGSVIAVDNDGGVHAKLAGPGGPFPGSLVVRRAGQPIAEVRQDGSLAAGDRTTFPKWMR